MKTRLLCAMFLLLGMAFTVKGQEVTVDGVRYAIVDGEAFVMGMADESKSKICVASCVEYEGIDYPVKSIVTSAFSECASIQSVTISEGVEVIGKRAFYKCTSLSSVTIPSSMIRIVESAF